jgi:molybdopterin molybdotransferase
VLTPAQAETLIEQHLVCLPIESLPLTQAAGAVLRENIYAERDHPPFDRAALDGIALSSALAGTGRLRVIGLQTAGGEQRELTEPQTCIEILAGAVLPRGCDAVVPTEQLQRDGGLVEIGRQAVQPWQFVNRRGCSPRARDSRRPRLRSPRALEWRGCA